MKILVGTMEGIRNPTTHANLNSHPDESWERIVLISHLINKITDKQTNYKAQRTTKYLANTGLTLAIFSSGNSVVLCF